MSGNRRVWRRLEIWLKEGDTMRRPMSRNTLPWSAFEAQRQADLEYEIWQRVEGTFSDGKGGRPAWEKI